MPHSFGKTLITDWQGAGLIKPLVLKPVLTTIEQNLVVRPKGTLSLDELIGTPLPKRRGKGGPSSRLQQQIEAVEQLTKTKQQFVSQMLDTVLAQAGR